MNLKNYKYTKLIYIINSIQENGLIGSESIYIFNNISVSNIITNGYGLFKFENKNAQFNNVRLDNVKNVGDINDSSIIYFDSGDENKTLIFDNINITNCESNGNIIKILGNINTIEIKDSEISNNDSYGSIFNIESKNV